MDLTAEPFSVPSATVTQPTRPRGASVTSTCSSSNTPAMNNDTNKCFALQWNVRGLRANISELKQLIAEYNPCVIALQETKVRQTTVAPDFVGKNYSLLLECNKVHYWQHGVGLAIREGIPFERVTINTTLQLVAVRIHKPFQVTVVSIYIPPSTQQCQPALSDLFNQIHGPVIFLGDFNAHHIAWGSQSSSPLGRFIAEATLERKLVILNHGSPTRIDPTTGNASAIDISFCSENLASKINWHTLTDTCNSDHFPIIIGFPGRSNIPTTRSKWFFDRADWSLYERITAESIRPEDVWDVERFTKKIIEAATKCIPRSSGLTGPKSVPWWSPEVKDAIKRRRKCLRALRRLDTLDNERPAALRRFQEARATARKTIETAKQKSWEDFVGKISPNSTTTDLWRSVNALRGKRQHRTPVLKLDDGYTDDPNEIAEILAKHYSERSATSNYPPPFQKMKKKSEHHRIELLPNTDDQYNNDLTLNELLWALDKGQSASTGPDLIGYPMLQRLPLAVKRILLEILNEVWRNGVFPICWRTAVIIPLPKPTSKNPEPDSFRPISLTSCLAKVLERIINRRLITELESNERLDKRQHAFRSGRGTDTYLAELERSLPTTDEHSLIASLDLSKAYDTTWRHGILRTLKSWRIRGRMMNLLRSFLSERSFQVCVGGQLSQSHKLENGVPQGSVLSVTLFLVAMQPIFKVVPKGVEILLYADDILLVVKGRKTEALHRKLQAAVKAVEKWTKSVGFMISATKSFIFYCSPNARRNPSRNITINGVAVPKTNRLKILGITLDRTLNFKAHCKVTKEACASRVRIMRMIGGHLPRATRTTMLHVGSAIITSKLLYGIGLISRGGGAAYQSLAPVYNQMVRFASGAFVTSPIASMMAEAGTLPFELLVKQSIARIAIRLLGLHQSNRHLPLVQRASIQVEEMTGVAIPRIAELDRCGNREWYVPKPNIVWDVKNAVRAGDPPEKVRPVVKQLISNRFKHSTIYYTDGSKCNETVGAGIFGVNVSESHKLPKQCSVFSAEAYAIKKALLIPHIGNVVIFTDSASCLLALEGGKSKHPWIQNIESMVHGKPVNFCWIPGHAGINGNNEADRLANEGRNHPTNDIPIPAEDAFKEVKQATRQYWERLWFTYRDEKLREIKFDTNRWIDRDNTTDQRVLTRLRIGHTRLTHSFLLSKEAPPICECCGTTLDVRHIVLHCRKYSDDREKYGISPTSLKNAMTNDDENETKLLQFLRSTKLYEKL